MRVLFFTRYPIEGASSRYRVFQYLPFLKELGLETDVQSFMNKRLYDLMLSPKRTVLKAVLTAFAIVRRLLKLWQWRQYDLIYMQRELFPFSTTFVERWLKKRGAVLIYDYDDALFIKQASRYNRLATALRSSEKTLELFRIVDCVVAGNDWLAEKAREAGCKKAVTLEVAEDVSRYRDEDRRDRTHVTIGWLGSPSTVKYLNKLEPVLIRIAETYPSVSWEIMGGNEYTMEGIPWTLTPWSLEGEIDALARFDIGLMPLPEQDWAKGKSGGKARTYMAAGVVPVVQAIGYNLELIDDGETGFLCNDSDEWEARISQLIDDADLRQSISVKAREAVKNRFDPAFIARQMASIIRETANNHDG